MWLLENWALWTRLVVCFYGQFLDVATPAGLPWAALMSPKVTLKKGHRGGAGRGSSSDIIQTPTSL